MGNIFTDGLDKPMTWKGEIVALGDEVACIHGSTFRGHRGTVVEVGKGAAHHPDRPNLIQVRCNCGEVHLSAAVFWDIVANRPPA